MDKQQTHTQKETVKLQNNKALIVISLATFLVPFMGSAINLALPEISKTFSMNAVSLTWLSSVYIMSTAIFQIPAARVADILGRRKIFLLGVALFALPTFLSGIAPNLEVLIILRFLTGLGSAMMFGTSMAIVTSMFQPPQRGKVMGITTAVVYASLAMGPLLGGLLTHYWGWQSIFFFSAGIGLLILILAPFALKEEWIESGNSKFDILGSVIYGISLFGIIYGFTNLSHLWGAIWLVAGIVAFIIFIFYENRIEHPILYIKLFVENRVFAFSSLAALINYAATFAIIFMLSIYLQYVRGLDAKTAGLILISQACVQAIVSLIVGHLSTKKIKPEQLATIGMMIIVVGLIGLIFISANTPFWLIIALSAVLGIGFGTFASPNTNVIMSSVDKKHYGLASGTTGTARLVGQSFSMGIAGMVISFKMGTSKVIPELFPEFIESMRITFFIFMILCIIGIFASNIRTKKINSQLENTL